MRKTEVLEPTLFFDHKANHDNNDNNNDSDNDNDNDEQIYRKPTKFFSQELFYLFGFCC